MPPVINTNTLGEETRKMEEEEEGYFTCAVSVQHKETRQVETSSAYSASDSEQGRRVVWPQVRQTCQPQSQTSGKTFQGTFKQSQEATRNHQGEQPHKWLVQSGTEEMERKAGQRISRSHSRSKNIMERARSFERGQADSRGNSRPQSRAGSTHGRREGLEENWVRDVEGRPQSRTDVDSRRFGEMGRVSTSDWENRIRGSTECLASKTPPPRRKEMNLGREEVLRTPEPPPPPARLVHPPNTVVDFPPPPTEQSELSEESVGQITEENKENSVKQWVESTGRAEELVNELEKFAYNIAESVVTSMEQSSEKKEFSSSMVTTNQSDQSSIQKSGGWAQGQATQTGRMYFTGSRDTSRERARDLHGPVYCQEDNRKMEERKREEEMRQQEAKRLEAERAEAERIRMETLKREEEERRRMEEMRRRQEEERRKQEEEKRRQEEERRRQEEEKRKQEELRLRQLELQKAEEERRREEEERKRREEEERKRKEEEERRRMEELARLRQEEEARRQEEMRLEQELRKQLELQQQMEQEEHRRREEAELRRRQEEEMRRRQEEEMRRRQEEEMRKRQEEEMRKRQQEEEMKRKQEEELKKRKAAPVKLIRTKSLSGLNGPLPLPLPETQQTESDHNCGQDHLLAIKTGQVMEKRTLWAMRSASMERLPQASLSPAPRRRRLDWGRKGDEDEDGEVSRPGSSLGQAAQIGSVRNLSSGFLAKSKSSSAVGSSMEERSRPRAKMSAGWAKDNEEAQKEAWIKSQEVKTKQVTDTVSGWGKGQGSSSGRSTPVPSRTIGELHSENRMAGKVVTDKSANSWRSGAPEPSVKLVNVSVEKATGSTQNIHISENAHTQLASFIGSEKTSSSSVSTSRSGTNISSGVSAPPAAPARTTSHGAVRYLSQ